MSPRLLIRTLYDHSPPSFNLADNLLPGDVNYKLSALNVSLYRGAKHNFKKVKNRAMRRMQNEDIFHGSDVKQSLVICPTVFDIMGARLGGVSVMSALQIPGHE